MVDMNGCNILARLGSSIWWNYAGLLIGISHDSILPQHLLRVSTWTWRCPSLQPYSSVLAGYMQLKLIWVPIHW